ncbi:hypothetical protein [Acidovorax sp. sic0104]|uniref:hypothetical protein n=1 Tax=Acidovorax sp. sic0104 TaxID=2854784 RepID=UPI001C47CD33|nr:hypothetical protein [Acidovorax sp. sic0104]MBV7541578.1 hypothetical protein [Acidovorax sp. sic0104]
MLILDIVLFGMFLLGCFGFWRAGRLFKRLEGNFLKNNYGIADASKADAASEFLAWLFVVCSLWLCIWAAIIWVFDIKFSLWSGIFLVMAAVHHVASQRVREKYGDKSL